MRALSRIASCVALALSAACVVDTSAARGGMPSPGADEFLSAAPGSNGQGTGATEKSATARDGAAANGTPRAVEEGDVYRVDGSTLYVLNMYRGLQVIDLADPEHPVKIGTAPVLGQPVEMYVRNGYAYLVVSDFFAWRTIDGAARPFRGSQVKVVDVRDPARPLVVGSIDFDGAVSDTRIVGDVLYVVANRWAWYGTADGGAADDLVLRSIDLSAPAAPVLKESLVFPGTSNVIHVSPTTLYVASTSYADWQKPTTSVRVVDIDDAHGALVERPALDVDGAVDNRFQLDEFDGRLRVVSHIGSWGQDGSQLLSVFQLAPEPQLVGRLKLDNTGGLFATRFDGDRAYLVTMVSVDPLEVVDLRDPANPVLTHSLVIPGVLQQLAPRGDRLLALGTDDRWSGLAASLFDVSDPQKPSLLARVPVGQGYAWSNALWDDKALRVVDEKQLMLVPFSGWTEQVVEGGKVGGYTNGFQILSFDLTATDKTALVARGVVEQEGTVARVFAHADRLVSLSDRRLQTVDATNLDKPVTTGSLELARDVSDFAVAGGHAVTLSTPGWTGASPSSELRVATLDDPEDGVVGRLKLPFSAQRLVSDGARVVVLGYPATWDGTIVAATVDLADAAAPVVSRTDVLGRRSDDGYSESLYFHAARIVAGKLVVPAWTASSDATGSWTTATSLVVLDVVTGEAGRIDLPGAMAGDLVADSGTLWASHSESVAQAGTQPLSKFFADRLDLADARHPSLAASVNVPGTLVGVSGDTLFTRDYRWGADGHFEHALAELTLSGTRAVLRTYLPVDDGLGRILVDGRHLYATTQPWWWSGTTANGVTLKTYASSRAAGLAEVSSIPVNDWVQLRDLAGGHLFLGNGYWGGPWDYGLYAPMAKSAGVADGVVSRGGADVAPWFGAASGLVDFSVADADHPVFRQSLRTNGWVQGLAVESGTLYVSGGIYGIQQAALSP